jgi:hypothetical protein
MGWGKGLGRRLTLSGEIASRMWFGMRTRKSFDETRSPSPIFTVLQSHVKTVRVRFLSTSRERGWKAAQCIENKLTVLAQTVHG